MNLNYFESKLLSSKAISNDSRILIQLKNIYNATYVTNCTNSTNNTLVK